MSDDFVDETQEAELKSALKALQIKVDEHQNKIYELRNKMQVITLKLWALQRQRKN